MSKPSYVYISVDAGRKLTIEVTKDLDVAAALDREAKGPSARIVYAEEYPTILEAHDRLKALRKMSNKRREKLISARNPEWRVLTHSEVIRAASTWLTDPPFEDEDQRPDFGGGAEVAASRNPVRPRTGSDAKSWQV